MRTLQGQALALAVAVVAILIADVAALVGSLPRSDSPAVVDVRGHVIERGAETPLLAARSLAGRPRAPHPPRTVGQGHPQTPPAFSSGSQTAPPPPAPVADVPSWLEERGAEALSRISYPWQRLGFTIEFQGGRPGLRAVTYTRARRIVVFVRRDEPVAQTAFDLAHELGHAFDVVHGTWPLRDRWLELRGIEASTPWFGCSGCDDLSTGAGDLAEVFALWQVGGVDFASRLAPAPGRAELADLIELFDPGWTSRDDPTLDGSADDGPSEPGSGEEHGADEQGDPPADGGEQAGDDGIGDDSSDDDDDGDSDGDGDGDGDGRGDQEDGGGDDGDGPLPCPLVCDSRVRLQAA